MEIKPLSKDVVEKIAAGEVLERPANLVKELVENSIDAEATSVEIDFDQGGKSVRVTDNGHGMSSTDLPFAFQRHATSKITSADDLWKLGTFGFRGEALASISSVSRTTIISKTNKDKTAHRLSVDFGELGSPEPVGGAQGTIVSVRDLFENVPARLKFLKSDSAEGTQMKRVLKAQALSYPSVSIKITSQGGVISYWPARKNFKDRVEQVLSSRDLFYHSAKFDDLELEICFSSPTQVEKTSQQIWIFVQNRWVQDKTIQAAVMEAYRNLLMHGEYPLCVVKLKCPTDWVDVNVHPTKSQVKFQDNSLVFRAVQSTLREVLEKAPWGPSFSQENTQRSTFEYSQNQMDFQQPAYETTSFRQKNVETIISAPEKNYEIQPFWAGLQVLGQANLTYILAQSRNSLFLIDQHASHERIVFERLMSAWRGGQIEVQEFLIPMTFEFENSSVESLLKHKEELQKLGLVIDQVGPETLSLRSAPALLKDSALLKALHKMSEDIEAKGGSFALEKSISDLCATMACHSVIRAGQALSSEEMKELLNQMDEYPLSGFCPHGRPAYVEYSFAQLDKNFGRIV